MSNPGPNFWAAGDPQHKVRNSSEGIVVAALSQGYVRRLINRTHDTQGPNY